MSEDVGQVLNEVNEAIAFQFFHTFGFHAPNGPFASCEPKENMDIPSTARRLRVLQQLLVVLAEPFFSAIINGIITFGETYTTNEVVKNDLESTEHFILSSIFKVICNIAKDVPVAHDTSIQLFEYLFSKMKKDSPEDILKLTSSCLAELSQTKLGELCTIAVNRLRTNSEPIEQQLYRKTINQFGFGVDTSEQRHSLMLYLSYLAGIIHAAEDSPSMQVETCNTLQTLYKKILRVKDTKSSKAWEQFCQLDESLPFWKKLEDIYRGLAQWISSQGKKEKFETYRTMVIMVGFSRAVFREKFALKLFKLIVTDFPSTESYTLMESYYFYLKFSNDLGYSSTDCANSLLEIISDNLLPKITDLPDSSDSIESLICIGIETGLRNLQFAMESVITILSLDYAPEFKAAALIILTELSQVSYAAFTQLGYHKSLFPVAYQLFLSNLKTVKERDATFANSPKDKPSYDHAEIVLAATIQSFSHLQPEIDKETELIDKLIEVVLSPVFDVAESALFCLRDYTIIFPGKYLVYILNLMVLPLSDYFTSNIERIKRCLHNISVIIYYFDRAIAMDFDMDELSGDKFSLLRSKLEGFLLVWLCSPVSSIYDDARRILDQITSPKIRKIEQTTSRADPQAYLVDYLPRKRRCIGGTPLVIEISKILDKHYTKLVYCVNWAFSDLFSVASHSETLIKDPTAMSTWSSYFKLLCIIPRRAPSTATFSQKSRYLSSGLTNRFFEVLANLLNASDIDLQWTTDPLKGLHPDYYSDFIGSMKGKETDKKGKLAHVASSPLIISVIRQFLFSLNQSTFEKNIESIAKPFGEVIRYWFTHQKTVEKFSPTSKRDVLLITKRFIHFKNSFHDLLPDSLKTEDTTYFSQMKYFLGFTDGITLQSKEDVTNERMFPCLCAQIEFVTDLVALDHENQLVEADFLLLEENIVRICNIGDHLQEFTDGLFLTYLAQYPQRFRAILDLGITHSPSITEENLTKVQSYAISIPVLRAVVSLLTTAYTQYITNEDNLFHVFFIALYFQCSFEIVARNLAIEIAQLLSNDTPLLSSQVASSNFFSLKISFAPPSPVVGLDSKKEESLINLTAPHHIPHASHLSRDVYLAFAKRYSKGIATKYDKYTRDILLVCASALEKVALASDVGLLFSLLTPLACNYGTSLKNPPRWIIRVVFDITCTFSKNDALIEPLQQLWREMVAVDSVLVARMGMEWLFENCVSELKKNIVEHHSVHTCVLAGFNLIHHAHQNFQNFATSFLLSKLRSYREDPPLGDISNIRTWLQQPKALSEDICPCKERAALLFLIPLCLAENFSQLDEALPLILQHCFVLDDPLGQFAYTGIGTGKDLIDNIVQGVESRLLHVNHRWNRSQVAVIREQHFPGTIFGEIEQSPLSRFFFPGKSPIYGTHMNANRARSNISSGRHHSIDSRANSPIYISGENSARLISLLEDALPTIRSSWMSEAFKWCLRDENCRIASNSLALYGSLTEKIVYHQTVPIILMVLDALEKGIMAQFTILSDCFLQIVQQKWFMFDLNSFEFLTSLCILLFQKDHLQPFTFALDLFSALYACKDVRDEYSEIITFSCLLWSSDKPGIDSTDKLIVYYLFQGLQEKETFKKTLWVLETYYNLLAPSLPLNNHILIATLLLHFILCIEDPKHALTSFRSLKEADKNEDFEEITAVFKKLHKKANKQHFLDSFYTTFVTVFPEEEAYQLALVMLQDLIRTSDASFQLATCFALGHFVQMNFIHDLTLEQCQILSDKALLCCNSSHVGAEESSEALLLFLLSDSRAKRPPDQFALTLEPDLLRADRKGHFAIFNDKEVTHHFDELFSTLQAHLDNVFPLSSFVETETMWNESICKVQLQKYHEAQSISLHTEEEGERIQKKEKKEKQFEIELNKIRLLYEEEKISSATSSPISKREKRKKEAENQLLIRIPTAKSKKDISSLRNILKNHYPPEIVPVTPRIPSDQDTMVTTLPTDTNAIQIQDKEPNLPSTPHILSTPLTQTTFDDSKLLSLKERFAKLKEKDEKQKRPV